MAPQARSAAPRSAHFGRTICAQVLRVRIARLLFHRRDAVISAPTTAAWHRRPSAPRRSRDSAVRFSATTRNRRTRSNAFAARAAEFNASSARNLRRRVCERATFATAAATAVHGVGAGFAVAVARTLPHARRSRRRRLLWVQRPRARATASSAARRLCSERRPAFTSRPRARHVLSTVFRRQREAHAPNSSASGRWLDPRRVLQAFRSRRAV